MISVNTFGRLRPGTVGQPIPGVEVRIAGDGEILVRGPNVMKGYYGDPEGTRAVLRGGFLATGDIGHFDGDGFLSITDRKKDLLITSAGKNVPPQPIENAIRLSRYIANVILFGDRKKYLTALVVPDFEALGPLAASLGLGGEPPAALASRPEIRALIETEIAAATAGFSEHERVRRFALLERDFDQDHGEVTPTLKLRRRVVAEHFRTVIEAMYGSS